MDYDQVDKRRFFEAAAVAVVAGLAVSGKTAAARLVVNQISELWDEIEHQCPKKESDR